MERDSNDRIAQSAAFKELIRAKRNFIVPSVVFILAFFLPWSVLTVFTTVLDGQAFSVINWALIYAYVQFVVAVVFCHLYTRKARQFDELGEQARQEGQERTGEPV